MSNDDFGCEGRNSRFVDDSELLVVFDNTPENMEKLRGLGVEFEISNQTSAFVGVTLNDLVDVRRVKTALNIPDDED